MMKNPRLEFAEASKKKKKIIIQRTRLKYYNGERHQEV